jgi:hypothetical protein
MSYEAASARTVLGSNHMHTAKSKIETLCQRSVKVMAPFGHDMKEVWTWCFSDDVRITLAHANDMIAKNTYGYGIATNGEYQLAEGEEIEFDFNYVSSLAPHKGRFELNPVTGKPLLEAIDQIKLIKRKFDLAEHVLAWLDGNVTAGAMRYYWPTVLSLAPSAPALATDAPARFNNPGNIAPFLPFIRDAASTIASALLLSEETDIKTRGMVLKLTGNGMKVGEAEFSSITRKFFI